MRTWVDASSLIALDKVGEVLLLRDLLSRVSITREVHDEVVTGRESVALRDALGVWIEVVPLRRDLRPWTRRGLGPGEASLLGTPKGDRLVLDDAAARAMAHAEGRDTVGLLGLLLAGVRDQKLSGSRARQVLRQLVQSGFHVASPLYEKMVREMGGEK